MVAGSDSESYAALNMSPIPSISFKNESVRFQNAVEWGVLPESLYRQAFR